MNVLPLEVDYHWHQEERGETVYVFNHPTFGSLGCLSIIPYLDKTRMIWEPVGEYLEEFMKALIQEISDIVDSPMECHVLPCSHCGLKVARLLFFPKVQDLKTLRACAEYHTKTLNPINLPTWIIGEGVMLETIWPIRKVFRPINSDELIKSLLDFQVNHCAHLAKD